MVKYEAAVRVEGESRVVGGCRERDAGRAAKNGRGDNGDFRGRGQSDIASKDST